MSKQSEFHAACVAVRTAWGLRTSTFEGICLLIAKAISLSTEPGVDQENAARSLDALWLEWTRWRAVAFMLASHAKVAATITRWPNGTHYYVRFLGDGVSIDEKFNTSGDAQKFFDDNVATLKRQGREIL